MSKKMLIDATHAQETRVVVTDGNKVEEFDFESVGKKILTGNIYLAKVKRLEPSLQAAFIEYGGNRHGFLPFSEIHPDYYQLPVADRQRLIEEEAANAAQIANSKPEAEIGDGESDAETSVADDCRDGVLPANGKAAARRVSSNAMEVRGDGDDRLEPELVTVPEESRPDPVKHDSESDDATAESGTDPNGGEQGSSPFGGADAPQARQISAPGAADEIQEQARLRQSLPRRYKIHEVIQVRQVLLVQVVKEERGNKGVTLTTYLSLAGRFCVLMPNTPRDGGISRKITNASERKKLKEIAATISVPESAGLIVRTAGAKRTKTEIKRDFEFLCRQWDEIRNLTLNSTAPTLIYAEGGLIKRSIRDLYGRDIDEVLVEGKDAYRIAKDYMKILMPSHANRVRHFKEPLPLFSRYRVEEFLSGLLKPVVRLPSGGYIVIDVTEALVAVDVNSGRSTKQASIAETALQTNLEAADEIGRQLRLRDLAGLIVIDFIDMADRRSNSAVEKQLKAVLKSDRARIQVGRISSFGILEMSRQRLRPGMLEATSTPCRHCQGTGITRSSDSLALSALRKLAEESVRCRNGDILLLRAPVEIANFLINEKRSYIGELESQRGVCIRLEADPSLAGSDCALERKRALPSDGRQQGSPEPVTIDSVRVVDTVAEDSGDSESPKEAPKRKRRRRRRGGRGSAEDRATAQESQADRETGRVDEQETTGEEAPPAAAPDALPAAAGIPAGKMDAGAAEDTSRKPPKRSRRRRQSSAREDADVAGVANEAADQPSADPETADSPKVPRKRRKSRSAGANATSVANDSGTDDSGGGTGSPADAGEGRQAAAGNGGPGPAPESDRPGMAGDSENSGQAPDQATLDGDDRKRGWWRRTAP